MFREVYRRHDLLRVRVDAWSSAMASAPLDRLDSRQRALIEFWARNSWPVIVCRNDENDQPDYLAVGLPLPPSLEKARVRLLIPYSGIATRLPPISVRDAMSSAPSSMHAQLDAIFRLGNRLGTRPTVFGSLMWQHATGLPYVGSGSDIDLLWRMTRGSRLAELLDELTRLDCIGPARIDGEILFVGGEAVNWKELARERNVLNGTVLVKSFEKAEVRCAQTLLA